MPDSFNRRQWAGAIAGLVLGSAQAPGLGQQPARVPRPAELPPKLVDTRIVIAMEQRNGVADLPLTVAEQRHFFREEGLEVELREYPDLAQAMAAVQAKAAHLACVPFAQLLAPPVAAAAPPLGLLPAAAFVPELALVPATLADAPALELAPAVLVSAS